jgi:NAD(P)-dependent dehydrogenase (short-subunit alcohol dehydrogenase family)
MTVEPLRQADAGEAPDVLKLFQLYGRTAIVTGAGRGLGQAMAGALAKAGAAVAVFDVNAADAQATAAVIQSAGGQALAARIDITDRQQVQEGLQQVLAAFGRIDILVNNAGVTSRSPFEDLEEQDWERVVHVNLGGVYQCTRAVAKQMILTQTPGSIINIASISGFIGNRGGLNSHYCASKGGVIALTRSLAVEWAPYGLRVNAIAPGYFVTPMTDRLKNINRAFYDELVGRVPLGRFGRGADLAGAVVYLASDASEFVTGNILVIDGGYSAW